MSDVTLLVMSGIHPGGSSVEEMMARARRAVTQDTIERSQQVAGISGIVLSTNDHSLADWAIKNGVTVELDPVGAPFHFGQRLLEIVVGHRLERVLYMGGGSGPLLTRDEMADIVERISTAERLCVANNLYSADLVGFVPGVALLDIEPPRIDNDLAWLLTDRAGLGADMLPRRASAQFDLDTPTDLLVLSLHPNLGRHVQSLLRELALDASRIERILPVLLDREAEVVVAGRVSAAVWAYMEEEAGCRVRVLAEERGMRASGRQAREEVRSILGYYYERVGPEEFFDTLANLGQCVILDSRVLLAHLRRWPPARDRYNSDLGRVEGISDEVTRELTAAAFSARVPVVMGGHSLVSGGLYALVEAARGRQEL